MQRVYNFSAGPSMLPLSVLERAARELVNYGEAGMSVMEMSHRSPEYEAILFGARDSLQRILQIPDNYKILFLQGGASTQFAAVCYNLLNGSGKADYVVTGQFSKKAMQEAQKYGDIRVAASSEDRNNTYIPALSAKDFRPDADYVHICLNNTIYGTRYHTIPDTGGIPLVADVSSCILSEPLDIARFGVVYAGAQKNVGPAGLTIVIVRDDLLGKARKDTPAMLNWQLMAENDSMYNTPPCYAIYMAGLVFEWLEKEVGGLEAMASLNQQKAAVLYDYLDGQNYYLAPAEKPYRSLMNVTFKTGDEELDKQFAKQAAAAGFKNIKGHRSVGGMRASIYNAMPREGVEKLVRFMAQFADAHPKA
ncbi:MAG: 3-phosphoserine/phosphohydroxythreonine transaminase [Clostridiales bacterium]|jgi:phosphoserine aminotransferase|nr:3-phosphoserine/phosphohydroxythreonine transaminase [Clostridiales bacterium]